MDIEKWKEREGSDLQYVEIAKMAEIHPSLLSSYKSGRRLPTPSKMKTFYIISKGSVTPNDWYKVHLWEKELKNDKVGNNANN